MATEERALGDLGNYRLIERLGEGGMGAVYRAVHNKLGRTVAIKVLQKDLTADRGIINRFFHEARAANTIRHQHVIEVYDFVENGQDVYFVMEYLKGHDLHDAIHRGTGGPMPVERAAAILEQIASALHATHARDIVHRDLKPENVFLTERDGASDFVKIFDFGIAKLDRPDGRSTTEGAVLGTPEYMSPEQARGMPVDGRADIYSLGCIAYEMLTRKQVFGGGGTQTETLVRQINTAPPPLSRFNPDIPAAVEAVVMRALAKDPDDRPQTALEFAEGIAAAMGRKLEDSAGYHSWGPARAITPKTLTPTPGPGLVLRVDRKRRGGWQPVVLGTALATVLTVGVLLARRQSPSIAAQPAATAAAPVAAPVVTVVLQSSPSGAEILDEAGKQIGVTPYDLVVGAGGERQVRFQKPGYQAVERRFRPVTDSTIAVHLAPEPPKGQRDRDSRAHRVQRSTLDSTARTIDPFAE